MSLRTMAAVFLAGTVSFAAPPSGDLAPGDRSCLLSRDAGDLHQMVEAEIRGKESTISVRDGAEPKGAPRKVSRADAIEFCGLIEDFLLAESKRPNGAAAAAEGCPDRYRIEARSSLYRPKSLEGCAVTPAEALNRLHSELLRVYHRPAPTGGKARK